MADLTDIIAPLEQEGTKSVVRAWLAKVGDRLSLNDPIVELETASPQERPRIAGVFLNRLRKGMRLQTDPTVIYALKLEGRYDGNIRKVDLSSDSPYNTYRFAGLPPGPIGSPGRSALLAVLRPEETDALYFVSRNDGSHEFGPLEQIVKRH